jgi:hypothetical protein
MDKKLFLFMLAFVFVATLTTRAMATGIGVYGTIGGGKSNHDYSSGEIIAPSTSSDLAIGGGLILDTNLASNKLFNYRMKIGAEKYTSSRETDIDMARIHFDNIFGFGIIRTKMLRWWIGPQVGGFYATNTETESYQLYFVKEIPYIILSPFFGRVKELKYGGFDIGAATGLNINPGKNFTIGVETGFKYYFAWGTQQRSIGLGFINMNDDMKLNGWELYGQVSFLFRFGGDNYSKK